jgi:hypothetical protein
MSEKARIARFMKSKITGIRHLEQQIRGYQLPHQRERDEILALRTELAHRSARPDSFATAANRIWADLLQNCGVPPKKRRYSFESLVWGREMHDISTAAYEVMSRILPLPSDRLLHFRFMNEKARICSAMLDLNEIEDLLSIWRAANNVDPGHFIRAILAVDVIAFKPLITIKEDGAVDGIEGFDDLESPDLFSELIANPRLFHDFVVTSWKEVHSAIFVFQIQPISNQFACCALHAIQVAGGKGTPETVIKFEQIRKLFTAHGLPILGYGFDGDSCDDRVHREFQKNWTHQLY